MQRYSKNGAKLERSLAVSKQTAVILMPSENQEEANEKWEKEMIEKFFFTPEDLNTFKRIQNSKAFLDFCELNGLSYVLQDRGTGIFDPTSEQEPVY